MDAAQKPITYRLKPREKAFVVAYYETFDGPKAARIAGWNMRRSQEVAPELLIKLALHIDAFGDRMMELAGVSNARVLKEYALLAFHDPKDFVDDDNNPLPLNELGAASRCVQSVENRTMRRIERGGAEVEEVSRKLKLYSKQAALDSLAKAGRIFSDVVPVALEVNFSIGGPLPAPSPKVINPPAPKELNAPA